MERKKDMLQNASIGGINSKMEPIETGLEPDYNLDLEELFNVPNSPPPLNKPPRAKPPRALSLILE